jgi:hypothetical protein
MKILFFAVFIKSSTNYSQAQVLQNLGHSVFKYDYREAARNIGPDARDIDMLETCHKFKPDLVIFSKCNTVSYDVFNEIGLSYKTCLWYMDPLSSYVQEIRNKTQLVDIFVCDKLNVLDEAKRLNVNSYQIFEGFDHEIEKIHDIPYEYDVSFIGRLYGDREEIINQIKHPVEIITGAYDEQHAIEVAKSKINLNFCTDAGASDRVYKILAAGGFLISDHWIGNPFTNGKHLVIIDNIRSLNEQIEYYLDNSILREKIALTGYTEVQKYNRLEWAKGIIKLI